MMDYRENAGYIITDSCHVGDSEFVLGVQQVGALFHQVPPARDVAAGGGDAAAGVLDRKSVV